MPSTLSLSCSKKLYELLGEKFNTEQHWAEVTDSDGETAKYSVVDYYNCSDVNCVPASSFSETIRLLPKIAERKEWKDYECPLFFQDVGTIYMSAPTEEEGMKRVSDYLEALL